MHASGPFHIYRWVHDPSFNFTELVEAEADAFLPPPPSVCAAPGTLTVDGAQESATSSRSAGKVGKVESAATRAAKRRMMSSRWREQRRSAMANVSATVKDGLHRLGRRTKGAPSREASKKVPG